ncbi:hypothetical protein BY996DRAFT_6490722 [Phakopsora pachyrhizi]|nr:hypothetical protein BY996DRAFT_6490722 [Phakopsora pachyrhizi]
MEIEECPIATTQATEIEAPLNSPSRTLKHQISHQIIKNPLLPTKRLSQRPCVLPKTQAGRQTQENDMSTYNVPIIQEESVEQPLFRIEEQVESEIQAPTEEEPILNVLSQQTTPYLIESSCESSWCGSSLFSESPKDGLTKGSKHSILVFI